MVSLRSPAGQTGDDAIAKRVGVHGMMMCDGLGWNRTGTGAERMTGEGRFIALFFLSCHDRFITSEYKNFN